MSRYLPTWHVDNLDSRNWRITEIFLGVWPGPLKVLLGVGRSWEVYVYPFEWEWTFPAVEDYGAHLGPFYFTRP